MIAIDGSQGEGGGQILRTSLALSLVTGQAFRIENIRAGRKKPGLLRQHLTAVQAAAQVGQAKVSGAAIGSLQLAFEPGAVRAGEYSFAVGTAGSATLVLQTVLPALLTGEGESALTLEGGTHNPFAPPYDFLAKAFFSLLCRMGPKIESRLERHGFYPAGGGRFQVRVVPAARLAPIELLERGAIRARRARALVANLPRHIGERELKAVAGKLGWEKDCLMLEEIHDSRGPGNAVVLEIEGGCVTEVFTGFGEIGVKAEAVAERAASQVREYLAAEVPVGPYLADQLLLPLALAAGGAFVTMPLTRHSETNIAVIRRFLPADIRVLPLERKTFRVEVHGPPA